MITIGSDPEVFLRDPTGEIISAIGHVGGTKSHPIAVMCGALQEDNVLAEFNTDPASTCQEFVSNLKTVMGQLRERVSPFELALISSHEFTKQQLMRSGRAAMMFGCDPDYNTYTGEKNSAPSARTTLRTAGGHVHVGYDTPSNQKNMRIGTVLDLLLGIPSVILDEDARRRTMYGKAGAIRHKPYGVEYRSLSNFWLNHTDLIEWVYHRAVQSVDFSDQRLAGDADRIQDCINHNLPREAELLIKKYKLEMP